MNLESLRYRNLSNYLAFYDYVSERIPKAGKTYLMFQRYLQFGGMPILREYRFNEARSNQALEGIYSTVVLHDILQRNN